MIIVVNDTNILIDLVKLKLHEAFFELDYSFHITDLVLFELIDEQILPLQPFIDKNILKVAKLSFDQLSDIGNVQAERPVLTTQDCSAFYLAKTMGATLVTSDNPLRKFAKSKQVDVHGHLWVFDRLVESKIITGTMACAKLEELNMNNLKLGLPKKECEKRVEKWTNI